jgi:hypothetical protein
MTLNREPIEKLELVISDAQGLMICLQTMAFDYSKVLLERPSDQRQRSGMISLIDELDSKLNEVANAQEALRNDRARVGGVV